MNILLTINDISITGGAERVCINLANTLCECGHSVEIVSFYRKNRSLPYDTNVKLNFVYDFGEDILRAKMLSNPLKKLYFKNLHKLILSFKIRRCYKNIHFIITNDWTFMPILKRKGTHYIKIHHSKFEGRYNKRNNLFNTLTILSPHELPLWQKLHNNVKVIPNFLPNIPSQSTNHNQKIVLSVGRMDKGDQKGFLRLLDIWKIVIDNISSSQDKSNTNMLSLQESCCASLSNSSSNLNTHILSSKENNESTITKHLLYETHTNTSKSTNISQSKSQQIDNTSNQITDTMTQEQNKELHKFTQNQQITNDSKITKKIEQSQSLFSNNNIVNDLTQWKLIIVGDGILKEQIESKIKSLNLQDSIILKPFTKNIEEEYLSASIYAMASHFEGFGMVLAEASSYALPCIAFNVATGPSDIIEHNKSGFLIDDNNLEDYANKLITLMSNENLRIKFGNEAKRIVSERFSKEVVMEKWKEVLGE